MKRTLMTLATASAIAFAADAQTLNVVVGNITYALPASEAGDMTYTGGTQLTIMGRTLNTADITRMYVDDSEVTDGTVSVSYNGTSASVVVAGNVAQYVEPTVSGAHVTIEQSDNVGDDTCGEITYVLSGTSTDGSFTLDGSYKASIEHHRRPARHTGRQAHQPQREERHREHAHRLSRRLTERLHRLQGTSRT